MLQQIYPQVQHDFQYELNKDMTIAAAHYIPHEDAGQCQYIHGHTYFINITIAGDELGDSGFLVNFRRVKELVHNRFDHSVLNNDKALFNDEDGNFFPSTEVIARTVYEIIQAELDGLAHKPQCVQVFVRETPTSYVVYRPKKKA
ncbi:6-pyruvoyl tetrahydropterin synthase family protein [Metabacillus fastidiosus]|uniref:6-carboxytetrahydropterin synthase n=1 Tax=Metabacillus fastidiosus TaxID=1458 RepID=UPI002DB9DA3F|nr:6-pyruvoyl tetrahydropterin synthase family protein [Metabacillus fastidiosus]MEC2077336.1 6-pyruvoyl tetrahydropterin synthase family protein [Metabacillus fastidiosus]MED4452501.1 6-pyruvoyl tetrahydropterin synthase family protein [Metabacillus fastidiosus]MED4532938.1 6-pyruvoyl tetrahydropterin synthase family protein [Metabacillus fastidiosus]